MAVMAPTEADKPKAVFEPLPREGPTREELESALADTNIDDLKERARRLTKSHENMNIMLDDLADEKKGLQAENIEIQQTIDRFMKELQKLNISGHNTVEPQLQEDPLIFVNRMWERMKPRDTGVVVSEHVGEIKKPVAEDENSPQHREKVRQVVENVQSAVGPLWERGMGAWSNFRQKMDERNAPPEPKKQPRKKKESPENASTAAAPQAAAAKPASSSAAASTVPVATAAEVTAAPAPATAASEAPATAASEAAGAAAEEPAQAATEETDKAAADEQISSTILIEAELTLDDGSVQTLQVRAADRAKIVAQNFIQEHSLKASFSSPLTKWLKQVEADAVKFPVKVTGDLMEIRKQHK